jgi:hypothetical protein
VRITTDGRTSRLQWTLLRDANAPESEDRNGKEDRKEGRKIKVAKKIE